MLFVNLTNLKIIKEYKYSTKETGIQIEFAWPISKIKDAFSQAFSPLIKHDALAVHYIINIESDDNPASEDEIRDFLSVVNVGCVEFFRILSSKNRRNREYRLDVPTSLKGVKTSMSLLKEAVNNETINDVFNLTIKYKDLYFVLCDEKDFEDKKEFVHDLDELEEKPHAIA